MVENMNLLVNAPRDSEEVLTSFEFLSIKKNKGTTPVYIIFRMQQTQYEDTYEIDINPARIEGVTESSKDKLMKRLNSIEGITLPELISSLPKATLELLSNKDIALDCVDASADEGIFMAFHHKNNYYSIEFFPDGEVIMLQELKEETLTYGPVTWGSNYEFYTQKLNAILV